MHKILVTLISVVLSANAQLFQRYNASDPESTPPVPLPAFQSVLPTPVGPYYGFPFNLSSTMTRPLPFTVSGSCEAGKIYTVANASDLITNYKTELECVYNAGLVPTKIPEGSFNGSILSVINTQMFNNLVGQYWKGQSIKKLPCNDKEAYIGINTFRTIPFAPFLASLGPLNLNLAPGEYNDGKGAIITDYTKDFRQICPTSDGTRNPLVNNPYPLNQNIDALRFVGKQEDGGAIYLAKSYLRDYYRNDLQAATVGYYYIVSYDNAASPFFLPGAPLPPLVKSFKYMIPGVTGLLFRILPIDNLITTPVRTIDKFVRGVWKSGGIAIARAAQRRTAALNSFPKRP